MGILLISRARTSRRLALGGALAVSCAANVLFAQSPSNNAAAPAQAATLDQKKTVPSPDKTLLGSDNRAARDGSAEAGQVDQALLEKFEKLLTGAKMIGMFTVDGRPLDKLSAEQYEIQKVEKQAEGDWWMITARMKYGEKDFSVPVPVEVKWAGTTPVITLDNVTLPGYGTFSARVVFHGERYAGTWQHDQVGGHLFGKVELAK